MPMTIPHRELRNNSSAVLRDVQAGETVYVTNNDEVVAVLVPPVQAGNDMFATGTTEFVVTVHPAADLATDTRA